MQREISRQVTQRITKARSKGKEDVGLMSLRKNLKDIVEKRNQSHKEKASSRKMGMLSQRQSVHANAPKTRVTMLHKTDH